MAHKKSENGFPSKQQESKKILFFGGSKEGGFQKRSFGRCALDPQNRTSMQKTERRHQKPERGCKKWNDGIKNWNGGTFAKPPFYKTALLFPLDFCLFDSCLFSTGGPHFRTTIAPFRITQLVDREFPV